MSQVQAPAALLLGEAHPVHENRESVCPMAVWTFFYERKISCPSQEMSDCLVIQPIAWSPIFNATRDVKKTKKDVDIRDFKV